MLLAMECQQVKLKLLNGFASLPDKGTRLPKRIFGRGVLIGRWYSAPARRRILEKSETCVFYRCGAGGTHSGVDALQITDDAVLSEIAAGTCFIVVEGVANAMKMWVYKCNKCGYEVRMGSAQPGDSLRCPLCGSRMHLMGRED
jgi:DNA-directed RNA polymerase subunit RPC12/RpoP